MKALGFFILLSALIVVSCKTFTKDDTDKSKNLTADSGSIRTPSSQNESDFIQHLDATDVNFIKSLYKDVKEKTKDEIALDSIVRTSVMLGGMGMKLMAAFDLKIEKIAAKDQPSEKDLDYIKNDITCQLWESSFVQHISQDKINLIQNLILRDSNADLYKRFLMLFGSGGNDNPSRALAKANILRVLKWNHERFCQLVTCPPFDASKESLSFPFDLFSDAEMAKYYRTHKSKMRRL